MGTIILEHEGNLTLHKKGAYSRWGDHIITGVGGWSFALDKLFTLLSDPNT